VFTTALSFHASYNGSLMTCPYPPVTVASALFRLTTVSSCGTMQLLLHTLPFLHRVSLVGTVSPTCVVSMVILYARLFIFYPREVLPIAQIVGALDRVLADCHSPFLSVLLL